jgi:hypothetical protein
MARRNRVRRILGPGLLARRAAAPGRRRRARRVMRRAFRFA